MKSVPVRLGAAALLCAGAWLLARALDPSTAELDPTVGADGASSLNPLVRVRLSGVSGASPVALELHGRWTLRDPSASEGEPPLLEGTDYAGLLQPDPTGLSLLPHLPQRDRLVFETDGDDALRIGQQFYPGRLHAELVRDDDDRPLRMLLTLELPLEDYVLGVVSGEMASTVPGAGPALAAQAVAARTYAQWKLESRDFLWDDTRHQVFRGSDYHTGAARHAVASTRGLVLTWNDALLPAYFHARCGGRTADAERSGFVQTSTPPLRGVDDPQCRDPYDRWSRTVPTSRLDRFATDRGIGSFLRSIRPLQADSAGRVLRVRVVGTNDHDDVYSETLRTGLGLPSTQWTRMHANPDGSLTVEGVARGHGVGLCQRGAMRLAEQGHDFASILGHYFPGAQVRPLAAGLEP